jgi:hypothetical protein
VTLLFRVPAHVYDKGVLELVIHSPRHPQRTGALILRRRGLSAAALDVRPVCGRLIRDLRCGVGGSCSIVADGSPLNPE